MRSHVQRSLPPFLAWAAALTALAITAALGHRDPFAWQTWSRWDSGHYESIAAHGYTLQRCAAASTSPGTWCGNAGWFPLYPWLLAALHALGPSIGTAGLAVAWAFALAALLVIWHGLLRPASPWVGATALGFAAFMPGVVYAYAVFPISLFVTFTALCVVLLARRRWALAGGAGFLASLSYPVGVMVLPVVAALWALRHADRRRIRSAAAAALPPLLALAVVMVVQQIEVGRWSAFFDVQRKYGHGVHDPFGVMENAVLLLWRAPHPFTYQLAASWQITLVGGVVAMVALAVLARWGGMTRVDKLVLVFACVAWLLPLTQNHLSVWRSQTALAPVAVLVSKLPRPLAVTVVAAMAVVGVAMARLFFDYGLV